MYFRPSYEQSFRFSDALNNHGGSGSGSGSGRVALTGEPAPGASGVQEEDLASASDVASGAAPDSVPPAAALDGVVAEGYGVGSSGSGGSLGSDVYGPEDTQNQDTGGAFCAVLNWGAGLPGDSGVCALHA